MPHHISRIHLRRHFYIWWVWQIVAVNDDGTDPRVIAHGANLRRSRANAAIDSWQRIYLRRLGRY